MYTYIYIHSMFRCVILHAMHVKFRPKECPSICGHGQPCYSVHCVSTGSIPS